MNDRRQFSAFLHPRYDHVPTSQAPAALAEWMRSAAKAYREFLWAGLERAYGWTELETDIDVDRARRQVVVRGHTILRSVARRFARGLRSALGTRYDVVVSLTTAEERASWHALREPVSRVWRDVSAVTPATELLCGDGPVQLLARTRRGALVRGVDATAGWTFDPLGAQVATPSATPHPAGGSWGAAARSLMGVPYRTGGTTYDGMDCSGLVQRLYREVLGATTPRHSQDQFSSTGLRSGSRREGQVVFVSGRGESPFHVGVLVRSGRGDWSVVHASSSRGMVVEDAYDDYLARGGELKN